jgi:hypothetical protein
MPEYMTNFTEEDMQVSHAKGSKGAEKQKADEEAQTQQTPAETPAEAASPEELAPEGDEVQADDEVPEGTTAEILAWVGDDQDRAQRALDKENADDKPRTGLTGELEKKLDE